MNPSSKLPSLASRRRWMRLDTAQILKRFYFCERSLIISCSAWLPHIESLELKTMLPLFNWQNAETAQQMRARVLELRYPARLVEQEGADQQLIDLFDKLKVSPSVAAFLSVLAHVLLPELHQAYTDFLKYADKVADAPTHRFMALALEEKQQQIATLATYAQVELAHEPQLGLSARRWAEEFRHALEALGGVATHHPLATMAEVKLLGARSYETPATPGRDPRYWPCRYYWPDNIDPSFPYGEGPQLQLRSAISHLNEVWAVETGGVMLNAFAEVLPWEWIRDAARWTYDEARHCRMGMIRLASWGFMPNELPLGTYIYESAATEDPIYRLGMLFFFETKNIGHKPRRIQAFRALGDAESERDMDFDWADETIHAAYGKTWLQRLLKNRGADPETYDCIREHCGELIAAQVRKATPSEVTSLNNRASALIKKAATLECLPP